MGEKPIKFSGEMVRAILNGRKTQTRRVIKNVPDSIVEFTAADPSGFWGFDADNRPTKCIHSRYGEVGDTLRISEDVNVQAVDDERYSLLFAADLMHVERYGTPELIAKIRSYKKGNLRGVHLPSAYARSLRLEITGVRVERLNDISESDAQAEGIQHSTMNDPRVEFRWLWESIYGVGSWSVNPWVWVYEFRNVEFF